MPSTNELIFKAIDSRNFNTAIQLLEDNPEEISGVDPENNWTLLQSGLSQAKPQDASQEFLEYVIKHKDFDLYAQTSKGIYQLTHILDVGRVDLLKLRYTDQKTVYTEKCLAYEYVKHLIFLTEKAMQSAIARKATPKVIELSQNKINQYKELLSLLRDLTIAYAVQFDDANLFDSLQELGAKPTEKLAYIEVVAGKTAQDLMTPQNKNLRKWFRDHPEYDRKSVTDIPSTFHNNIKAYKEAQEKLEQLKITDEQKKTQLFGFAVQANQKRIETITKPQ